MERGSERRHRLASPRRSSFPLAPHASPTLQHIPHSIRARSAGPNSARAHSPTHSLTRSLFTSPPAHALVSATTLCAGLLSPLSPSPAVLLRLPALRFTASSVVCLSQPTALSACPPLSASLPLCLRSSMLVHSPGMRAVSLVCSVGVCVALLCALCSPCGAQPPPLPLPAAAATASASAASSPPLQLSATERTALLDAAARSGYSASEALSLVATAYRQHIPLPGSAGSAAAASASASSLLSNSASCPPVDAGCSFARACAECYYDNRAARCLPCLQLLECQGQPHCQLTAACRVCSNIPRTAADRPTMCSQAEAHC